MTFPEDLKYSKEHTWLQAPTFINDEPYGEGWMMKIEITNPAGIENLLEATAYHQLTGN